MRRHKKLHRFFFLNQTFCETTYDFFHGKYLSRKVRQRKFFFSTSFLKGDDEISKIMPLLLLVFSFSPSFLLSEPDFDAGFDPAPVSKLKF